MAFIRKSISPVDNVNNRVFDSGWNNFGGIGIYHIIDQIIRKIIRFKP